MNALSDRAERIAGVLVGGVLGATAVPLGPTSPIDYHLAWDDGRRGALEVTLVVDGASADWQSMAMADEWCWPAPSSWELRLATNRIRYRATRSAVLELVALCDVHAVDSPRQLPDHVAAKALLLLPQNVGELRRAPMSPGVRLFLEARAGFLEAEPLDFVDVLESWLDLPHVPRHVEKTLHATGVSERHLFITATDDALPIRFFTSDFAAPGRRPTGFDGLDGLRIWSNYWHRFLGLHRGVWDWWDFPDA